MRALGVPSLGHARALGVLSPGHARALGVPFSILVENTFFLFSKADMHYSEPLFLFIADTSL